MPLFIGIGTVVLIGALAAFFLRGKGEDGSTSAPATAAPTTMTPETSAAMAKVKELEDKLRAIEAEKAAATAKAEDDARKKVEAQAAAKGQAVDPVALQRAQDEARKKAEAEQARKLQEEQRRLEDEQKAAEAQLAEERRKEEEARAAAAAVATTVAPAPTTLAGPKLGALVQLSDPGVIAPVVLSTPPVQYPPIALRSRIEGKVELSILVDEKGAVVDAKVTSGAGGKAGLNEAALENVRRRRYRPATQAGVAVKVWLPVNVSFVLPR